MNLVVLLGRFHDVFIMDRRTHGQVLERKLNSTKCHAGKAIRCYDKLYDELLDFSQLGEELP